MAVFISALIIGVLLVVCGVVVVVVRGHRPRRVPHARAHHVSRDVRTVAAEDAFAALLDLDVDDPDWKPVVVRYSPEEYRNRSH